MRRRVGHYFPVILAPLAMVTARCNTGGGGGGGDGGGGLTQCTGQYTGTFSGGDSGTISMNIDNDGRFVGDFQSDSGPVYQVSGTVTPGGEVSGIMATGEITGDADLIACSGLGNWSLEGVSGSWTISRGGTGGGGTGGAGGDGGEDDVEDPFPDVQFQGGDPELDANLIAIADASEQAVGCLAEGSRPQEETVLFVLKAQYNEDRTLAATLEDYVAETAVLEQARADEICDTTLDNASEELLALVARLTVAANRSAECLGEPADETDEDSLEVLKKQWLPASAHVFPTLTDFASEFVPEVEAVEC